jgi:hypothetical protein
MDRIMTVLRRGSFPTWPAFHLLPILIFISKSSNLYGTHNGVTILSYNGYSHWGLSNRETKGPQVSSMD